MERGREHYCFITDLSRLISPQISESKNAMLIYRRCFKTYNKMSLVGLPYGEYRMKTNMEKYNKNTYFIENGNLSQI